MWREFESGSADEFVPKYPGSAAISTARKIRNILFVVGLVALLVALLFPTTTPCDWPAARRAQCMNNLKQIALAMHNYQTAYGALPPAFITDEQGRPWHSWRVLVLPFLEQQSLYDQYDFREPWDGPNNVKLLSKMPALFGCPENYVRGASSSTCTSYAVITGPGTMFPGIKSVRLDQVTDGEAETIMVAETANVQIPWTKPEDLDVNETGSHVNDRKYPSISSNHAGGANVAFGDGSCRFLRDSTSALTLKSLVTIAGHESIPPNW